MSRYAYKAIDNNKIVQDIIEEESLELAKEKIKNKGMALIDINIVKDVFKTSNSKKKLKEEELENFCGQIAIIVESGINLIAGLEILVQQTQKKNNKIIFQNVLDNIRKGSTLSDSMNSTKCFPDILVDIVKSGEVSGNLDKVLYNMENYYQRSIYIRKKVKSSTTYPKILLFASIGMLIFFTYFIMPVFKGLFGENMDLPIFTRILLNSTEFFNNNIVFIIIFIIIMIIITKLLLNKDNMKQKIDYLKLKIPGFGVLSNYIIISRVSRTLSILFKAGIPIFTALENMQMIVDNKYIAIKISNVRKDIMEGMKIAECFEKEELFEPLVTQMIRVGEETGRLDDILDKLANIYDKKIEAKLTSLMGLIEPMFTLIVGLVVGLMIIALALPILTISQNIA